jgi:hypothetical protein
MKREEHLLFCSVCKNRSFNSKVGFTCSLTNQIADFEENCENYDEDIKVVESNKINDDELKSKKGNKFSFGIGLFFILVYGITIFTKGFDIKTSVFFALGIYFVWQNGFVKDTSMWRFKPIKIILIVTASTICLFIIIFLLRIQNSGSNDSSKKDFLRELANKAKTSLPMDLGNGDSIIDVNAVNSNTLKYEYKTQYSTDSIELQEIKSEYKKVLMERFKSFDNKTLNSWRKSKINFIHEFKDSEGKFAFNILIKSGEY